MAQGEYMAFIYLFNETGGSAGSMKNTFTIEGNS